MADELEPKTETPETVSTPEVQLTDAPAPEAPEQATAAVPQVEGMPEGGIPEPPQKVVTGRMFIKPTKREWIIILLLLLAFGAAGYWFWMQRKPAPVADNSQKSVPTKQVEKKEEPAATLVTAEDLAQLEKFVKPTTGEVWYAAAKPLADQKFFPPQTTDQIVGEVPKPEYKEVGTRAGNRIILGSYSNEGPGGPAYYLFEVSGNGTVRVVIHPDAIATYPDRDDPTADYFAKSVVIDTTTHYDSLTVPKAIDLGDGYIVSRPEYPRLDDGFYSAAGSVLAKQLGNSAIVKVQRTDATTHLTSYGYLLQFPFKTAVGLRYEPLETALKDYKWQNNVAATDKLHAIARGCGGLSAAVTAVDMAKDTDFELAGTSPSGQKVYAAKDPNYVLVNKAYDEFHQAYEGATDADGKKNFAMTKTEFLKQHGVVFYKDKSGQWLIFARDSLSMQGGCAKPVVYLYPTQTQQVSVRVGANVKVSDPLYDAERGWTALAEPTGQLVVNGKQYDSLFWEGPGYGAYPSITSGTVVLRSQAVATIRLQLAQQGLNTKEINDFMAYWETKIPDAPYVRLTWLTTAQLNELAPLHITPKPDTVIRVFLDMAGLDAPISLPAQQLKAIPRQGFTVVEWGGLALTKLY